MNLTNANKMMKRSMPMARSFLVSHDPGFSFSSSSMPDQGKAADPWSRMALHALQADREPSGLRMINEGAVKRL